MSSQTQPKIYCQGDGKYSQAGHENDRYSFEFPINTKYCKQNSSQFEVALETCTLLRDKRIWKAKLYRTAPDNFPP